MTEADDERYARLGADGDEAGLYVRFSPGFGLNVYLGHRHRIDNHGRGQVGHTYKDHPEVGREELAMSIGGWEHLCELVDEWRAREARHAQ